MSAYKRISRSGAVMKRATRKAKAAEDTWRVADANALSDKLIAVINETLTAARAQGRVPSALGLLAGQLLALLGFFDTLDKAAPLEHAPAELRDLVELATTVLHKIRALSDFDDDTTVQ